MLRLNEVVATCYKEKHDANSPRWNWWRKFLAWQLGDDALAEINRVPLKVKPEWLRL